MINYDYPSKSIEYLRFKGTLYKLAELIISQWPPTPGKVRILAISKISDNSEDYVHRIGRTGRRDQKAKGLG